MAVIESRPLTHKANIERFNHLPIQAAGKRNNGRAGEGGGVGGEGEGEREGGHKEM